MATTLRQFMDARGYDMISEVRISQPNGYPYVTMINSKNPNQVESVWFSKNAAEEVNQGDYLNTDTTFVYETTNTQGETRLKLSFKEGDAVATLESRGFRMVSSAPARPTEVVMTEPAGALVS